MPAGCADLPMPDAVPSSCHPHWRRMDRRGHAWRICVSVSTDRVAAARQVVDAIENASPYAWGPRLDNATVNMPSYFYVFAAMLTGYINL